MQFLVFSNDAFEEAAIIANLSKQGTHTWVPLDKASASVTHIVVHPDISSLSSKQRAGLPALKKKCMAGVVISRDVCRSFGFESGDENVDVHGVCAESVQSNGSSGSNGSSSSGCGCGGGGYSLEAVAHVRPVCVGARRPLRDDPDPDASYLAPKHWITMLPNDDDETKAPWAADLALARNVTTRDKEERVAKLKDSHPKPAEFSRYKASAAKAMRANSFHHVIGKVRVDHAAARRATAKFAARKKLTPFDSPEAFEQRLNGLDNQFQADLRRTALEEKERHMYEVKKGQLSLAATITVLARKERGEGARDQEGVPRGAIKVVRINDPGDRRSIRSSGGDSSSSSSVSRLKRQQLMSISELKAASVEAGAGSKQQVMLWTEMRGDGDRRSIAPKVSWKRTMSLRNSRSLSPTAIAPPPSSSPSPSFLASVQSGGDERDGATWERRLSSQLASLGQLGAHTRQHSALPTQSRHHQGRWVGAGSSADSILSAGSAATSPNAVGGTTNEKSRFPSLGGGHLRPELSPPSASPLGGDGVEGFDNAASSLPAQSSLSTSGLIKMSRYL